MGTFWNKMSSYFRNEGKDLRVIISGLDGAGKKNIINKLKLDGIIRTIPTIDFNIDETVTYCNIAMTALDIGGRAGTRPLWKDYYENSTALIFVIDSNDRDRIFEAREQLHLMACKEELQGKPILIFLNKQDLPNAMKVYEIRDKLNVEKFPKNAKWFLKTSCAISGDGIDEGLTWLGNTIIREEIGVKKPIIETFKDMIIMKNDFLSIMSMINLKTLSSKFFQL